MAPEILSFESAADFRRWLSKNQGREAGIWLRIFKKASGGKTVTYAEALEEALCHGWIDGQKRAHDAVSWLQRFTPRRPKSSWSKVNTGHAERLIREGRMKPSGHAQIEKAKADGRWAAAYDSPRTASLPEDFLRALEKNPRAKAFFATLKKSHLYPFAYRLQTAKKPETRERRMKLILGMLERGESFRQGI
jgi:uncharacterized protein YdeI (YjbR/CyaY-like superfamily)